MGYDDRRADLLHLAVESEAEMSEDLYEPGRFGPTVAKIVKLGFTPLELPPEGRLRRNCVLAKALKGIEPVCSFNDGLVLYVHMRIYNSHVEWAKAVFNIGAEIKGRVLKGDVATVSIDGITIDRIVPELPSIERRLIAAWQAVAAE